MTNTKYRRGASQKRMYVALAHLCVSAPWTAFGQTQEGTVQSQATPVFSVLYAFTGGTDGGYSEAPAAPLILDRQGNLYGTTVTGGDFSSAFPLGDGVVFKVEPTGTETDHLGDGVRRVPGRRLSLISSQQLIQNEAQRIDIRRSGNRLATHLLGLPTPQPLRSLHRRS